MQPLIPSKTLWRACQQGVCVRVRVRVHVRVGRMHTCLHMYIYTLAYVHFPYLLCAIMPDDAAS